MLLAFKKHVTVPGSGVTGPTMQPGRPWVVRSWLGGVPHLLRIAACFPQ